MVELEISLLRSGLRSIFSRAGMKDAEAQRVSLALVDAELCEVPTHGMLRLPWYLQWLRSGAVKPASTLEIGRPSPAVAIIDGGGALGYLPTWQAVQIGAELAGECGVSAVGVSGIAEFGRAGYYAAAAAQLGVVAIVCQNTPPLLAAPGARSATHGNNPLAFATPGENAPIFDAAFTPRSGGEVIRRAMLDLPLPIEWGYLDEAGNITTEAHRAVVGAQQAVGGAKGFGLAIMVDLLAGVLTSSASAPDIPWGEATVGAMVLSFKPELFGVSAAQLSGRMTAAAEAVQSAGGRWPGARGSNARVEALARGTILVPEPIMDAGRQEFGDALEGAVRH